MNQLLLNEKVRTAAQGLFNSLAEVFGKLKMGWVDGGNSTPVVNPNSLMENLGSLQQQCIDQQQSIALMSAVLDALLDRVPDFEIEDVADAVARGILERADVIKAQHKVMQEAKEKAKSNLILPNTNGQKNRIFKPPSA